MAAVHGGTAVVNGGCAAAARRLLGGGAAAAHREPSHLLGVGELRDELLLHSVDVPVNGGVGNACV